MASGESYWSVQPVEAPYVLDRADFGLEEGFWVIKVQHLQLTAIDPDTNHRTYQLTDETNIFALSAVVQHLGIAMASGLVLNAAMYRAILANAGVPDRSAGFKPPRARRRRRK